MYKSVSGKVRLRHLWLTQGLTVTLYAAGRLAGSCAQAKADAKAKNRTARHVNDDTDVILELGRRRGPRLRLFEA